ncbi:MAG TPA: hypothetical protein VNC61_10500 [Acidimicrobiales bacterium]|nr:hypothetical protein [Acidimicrobiales bacterium]
MTAPPATGMSLALPRAGALTEALLTPDADAVGAEDVAALRDRLAGDLVALVEELPTGERLRLDGYRFDMAREHPERCRAVEGPFTPSPLVCRRAIGLNAMARCVRGWSPTPAAAVAEVLAAGVEDVADGGDPSSTRPPWWAGWYRSLPAGGRAMVEAEAVTWATQVWTALEWDRFAPAPIVGGGDDWWDCPGTRRLTLRGRADVRVRGDGPPALLVVGSGLPPSDWRSALGFPALVSALARGGSSAPCRVVGLWPASGQVRILPVDAAALSETAGAVVAAVATWVDGRLEAQGLPVT